MGHRGRLVGVVAVVVAWGPAVGATVIPGPREPMPWIIESAEYGGELKDQIGRLEARYTIRVMRDGWVEIPLALQGATITEIEVEKKAGEAHLIPRGGAYVLAANRKGSYRVRIKCSTLLTQDSQFEGVQFTIPRATFSVLSLHVPRKGIELRQSDQLYVETQSDPQRDGVKLTARLGAADQVDLRWRTKPAAPIRVEPVLYGEVTTLVSVEEQLARISSIIDYRIAQGEIKAFRLRLPSGMNVLNVRGAAIEDWRVADSPQEKSLVITLSSAFKETTYRLLVEGEEVIGQDAQTYALPEIQLDGVKQERGYLAVSRLGSIELSTGTTEGIHRVDVRELPEQLSAALGTPALLGFKYHQHPYRAILTLTRHDDHPVLAAIAEQAELTTVVSQQGELLTRATYLIKANKKQFLEVVLPDGATLWSCLVSGRSVKPVEGAQKNLLVPLDAAAESAETVSVELVYFEHRPELVRIGQLHLRGPILDVPTTVANWLVYGPRAVKLLRVSGNLEQGAARYDFLEDSLMPAASANMVVVNGSEGDSISQARQNSSLGFPKASRKARVNAALALSSSTVDEGTASYLQTRERDQIANQQVYKNLNSMEDKGLMDAYGGGRSEQEFEEIAGTFEHLKETGILPLKIRLPKAGTVYRFNRLMTTQEALELNATFVHLPMPWIPFAAFGFLLVSLGGMTVHRAWKR